MQKLINLYFLPKFEISIIAVFVIPHNNKTKYQIFDYFIECLTFINERNNRKVCQKVFLNFLGLNKSKLIKKIQIDKKI